MGKLWVSSTLLESFCGTCLSLTPEMTWAQFYTRSLYWYFSSQRESIYVRHLCRFSHHSIRDLLLWRRLSQQATVGLPIHPPVVTHLRGGCEFRWYGQYSQLRPWSTGHVVGPRGVKLEVPSTFNHATVIEGCPSYPSGPHRTSRTQSRPPPSSISRIQPGSE